MANLAVLAQWRERFADCAGSGLSVEHWCASHGVSARKYYYWRRKLAKADVPSEGSEHVDWLSVSVCAPPLSGKSLTVRVGAVSVDVSAGFDPELLRDVVLAIAGAAQITPVVELPRTAHRSC
jgi:hypothetical protein